MAFYDKEGHKLRHRGGECYWCKVCKESHIITRLDTPNGPKYLMDPVRQVASEQQRNDFKQWLKEQGLKEPKDEADKTSSGNGTC